MAADPTFLIWQVIYVSLRDTEAVPPGWVKVSRTLPRSAQASHIYEVRLSANCAY